MKNKRLKIGLFWKTFFSLTLILLAIIAAAYALLYFLLPHYYEQYKTDEFNGYAESFIDEMKEITESDEYNKLTEFANEYNVSITVRENYENGNELYRLSQTNSVQIEEDVSDSGSSAEWNEQAQAENSSDSLNLSYSYTIADHTRYMQLEVPLQPLTDAKNVIINIYPLAVLICIAFSLIFSFLFSYAVVKPIKTIRKATAEMTELSPNAVITVNSSDEIGELSHDINTLYAELKGTIDSLKNEINKYSRSENKKIDFLRTVSHELKNPLASANALIEGIIYDVEPYNSDPKRYLRECKSFLEQAIDLTKESLNLSNGEYKETETECHLKELVGEVCENYRVIIKLKQIKYIENIPENIMIKTKRNLFAKALANIFSNAASYTDASGRIEARYDETENRLVIFNSCKPISKTELDKLFVPFNNSTHKSENSTGLGLYIVKQLLSVLRLRYEFTPTEKGDGMNFIIYFEE